MKVSVSLPDDDVEFLDAYARAEGFMSRSVVLHKAVGLLRLIQLEQAYEDAFHDWEETGYADDWEIAANDGIGLDASR